MIAERKRGHQKWNKSSDFPLYNVRDSNVEGFLKPLSTHIFCNMVAS